MHLKELAVFALLLLSTVVYCEARMNVLFLVSDDMRPNLNVFHGSDAPTPIHPVMHTPNLDMLASRSLLLKKAYVQQAVCSPSRTSLLTGRRPDTTHVYDLTSYFRKVGGNFTTIPQYFKQQGYRSVGMGKIFHPGSASGGDDPPSWSEPYYHAPNADYWFSKNISWRAVSKDVYTKKPLPDQQIGQHAQETLRKLAPAALSGEQPFFLAVGFHKPHLPFDVPEEYFSYYPPSSIRLPDNAYAPVHMPSIAWSPYGELRSYQDIKHLNASGKINSSLPDDVVLALRRAYYSGITYVDDLIGVLVAEINTLGLSNSTIISFWGDHGWQLGEHGEWCKHTNFELAVHAPMMVHIPGLTDAGVETEELTEYVDLFPTLVDAAGLPPMPLCPEGTSTEVTLCREGSSLLPLISNATTRWKDFAFSQYPRGSDMGYTVRSIWYRYTEWVGFNHTTYTPKWDQVLGVELYDFRLDPEGNRNCASDAQYSGIRKDLRQALHEGWRNALP